MKKSILYFAIALSTMLCFNSCRTLSTVMVPAISNPFYQLADVQLVGCYGDRSTATVKFVFTVTAHSNLITSGVFGQFPNSKFVARGQSYTPYKSGGTSVELVRYLPSDVIIEKVQQVPDYLVQFDRVELQWYFNPSHHSGAAKQNLVFNNVPIIWE